LLLGFAAFCVISKLLVKVPPVIVIFPLRSLVYVFAETVTLKLPLLESEFRETEIQELSSVIFQSTFEVTVTVFVSSTVSKLVIEEKYKLSEVSLVSYAFRPTFVDIKYGYLTDSVL
jgi:hypothetical protein